MEDDVLQLADGAQPPGVDMPFIFREGHDLRRIVFISGEPRRQMAKFMPKFREGLEFGLTSLSGANAMQDDRVKLAFESRFSGWTRNADTAGSSTITSSSMPRASAFACVSARWRSRDVDLSLRLESISDVQVPCGTALQTLLVAPR
jgi:hypothetical protein